MKQSPEMLSLAQAVAICQTHREGLTDALDDLEQCRLTAASLEYLSKQDRRLLDQFADRYTRLQDDMGTKLIPALVLVATLQPKTHLSFRLKSQKAPQAWLRISIWRLTDTRVFRAKSRETVSSLDFVTV